MENLWRGWECHSTHPKSEATKEKEDFLRKWRIRDRAKRAADRTEQRETRLALWMETMAYQRPALKTTSSIGGHSCPSIPAASCQAQVPEFRSNMAAVQSSICSTCLERLPGMKLCPGSSECMRWSSASNMDLAHCTPHNYRCVNIIPTLYLFYTHYQHVTLPLCIRLLCFLIEVSLTQHLPQALPLCLQFGSFNAPLTARIHH